MKSQLIPSGSHKYRENSADSVTFHLPGHTALKPVTATMSREIPTVRKNNLGTQKTYSNYRKYATINAGTPDEKIVPMILKIETSVPVGLSSQEVRDFFRNVILNSYVNFPDGTTAGRDLSLESFWLNGHLPDQVGDPSVDDGDAPVQGTLT